MVSTALSRLPACFASLLRISISICLTIPSSLTTSTPLHSPPGANWPPEKALDLLRATGPLGDDCVGCTRCDGAMCHDAWCQHTLERWCAETTHWQDHFELRKTEDRGIGVYTKRSFRPNDILGWYAGEIVPDSETQLENDYLMTVPIGIASELDSPCQSDDDSDDSYTEKPFPSPPRSRVTAATKPDSSSQLSVMVDSQRVGNWTRFINHSCESHAHFRMARVGDMRVMVVEAARNIPAGVELTVHYGPGYYGVSSTRICHCGARKCVSKDRKKSTTTSETS
jgi:hypothetical protein